MRNAPSVTYPVGRCVLYGRALFALGVSALLVWTMLGWYAPMPPLWLAGGGAVLCGTWGLMALRSWRRTAEGTLRWDALAAEPLPGARPGCWSWDAIDTSHAADPVRVEWVLDAQKVVLLRLQAEGRPRFWVWLEASRVPARWDDLRRALIAHT